MADFGKWFREKTGMNTPDEKRERGEDPRSERQKKIEAAAGDDYKEGKDKGEIGKKWDETFTK